MACELYVNKVVFKKAELSKEIEGIFLSFLCSKESFLHSPGLVLACCSHKYTGTWGFVIQSILLYVSQRAYFAKYTIKLLSGSIHAFVHFCKNLSQSPVLHQVGKLPRRSHVRRREPDSQQGSKFTPGNQLVIRDPGSRQGTMFSPGNEILTRNPGSHQGIRFTPGISVQRNALMCSKPQLSPSYIPTCISQNQNTPNYLFPLFQMFAL